MNERELRPVGRYEWEQIVRRARLAGVGSGSARTGRDGKATRGGISALTFKAVALTIATYGDDRGCDVFPGDATIAVDLESTLATVKAVKAHLVRLGLLQKVGGRRADRGQEYRLTLPTDLLDVVEVLTPAQHKLAARALNEAARGKFAVSSGCRETRPQAVDNSDSRYPADAAGEPEAESSAVSSGPPAENSAVSSGPPSAVSSGGAYPPGPHQVTNTHHSESDLRTAVTVPGAREADEDPFLDVGLAAEPEPDPDPAPARGVARVPRPERCEHGLRGRDRTDGWSTCGACRALAVRSDTMAVPAYTPRQPPDDGPLAQVIPIRRTA